MIKNIYNKLKGHFFEYHCPFCNGYWNQFAEHGFDYQILREVDIIGGGRRKHLCPNCSSSDRLRMIYSYIKSETGYLHPSAKFRVLHVAPERLLMEAFREITGTEYIAVDKFNYGGQVLEADITNLQFPDGYFDLVICNHVLEHIEDDRLAVAELYRVLKYNGKAILQVPYTVKLDDSVEIDGVNTPEDREINYGQSDHVRIYALTDFRNKLCEAGFSLMFMNPYDKKWIYSPGKLGLNERELLLLSVKGK